MLFTTEKYNFFQSRNPGIWALPIPGFGIEKNVRDPGMPGLQSLYLGVLLKASWQFKCSIDQAKIKFYRFFQCYVL